jgi:chromosome segregation ATPase
VDDKDVVRLEDRIEALGRESQLRLELAMAQIDAKFNTILQGLAALQTGLADQRAALDEQRVSQRAALDEQRLYQRAALDEHRASQSAALNELRGSMNDLRGALRGLYGLVAGAWITIIVAVVGSALGATALWGGGFQAGQASQTAAALQHTK